MSELYVSCAFPREEDLCDITLSLPSSSSSGACVFVWPEELLFYTSLSSPFCVVDLTNHRRQQAPHTDLKKIKNKERSLSLSLALLSSKKSAF